LLVALLLPLPAQAAPVQRPASQTTSPSDTDMRSTDGRTITAGGVSNVGDFVTSNNIGLLASSQAPALLARQDYQKVYEQAQALLTTGLAFRQNELQLPLACRTPAE